MFRFYSAEQLLRKLNRGLERFMPVLTPAGVILGLLLFSWLKPLKPLVTWLFAFLTLVNGMGVSVSDFGRIIRRPKPVLVFGALSYIIIPVLAALVSRLLFDAETALGFILLYSIPTAVAACIWAGIYNGSGALSLTILIIGTMLAPVSTPLTVRLLGGSDISIDTAGMMLSLLQMVVIPSAAGIAVNYFTKGRCCDHVAPSLKPFTKIALLMVISINTSQVAEELLNGISAEYIPPLAMALLCTLAGFAISAFASRIMKLSREEAVSVTFGAGMRNISAAMVIAIEFFPPRSVIPVISGIVFQQSAAAISAHFLFGRKPKNDIKSTKEKETAINEECQ